MSIDYGRRAECTHESTISVVSSGAERVVCEDCGDVTFRYESMTPGDVERAMFAREADKRDSRRGPTRIP